MTLSERLEFARAGLGVRRYHQRYTAEIDTVGKHSAGVAMFLIMMNEQLPSANLLAAALCHDLPEAVTGDIPSPAKRDWSPDARQSLAQQETELLMASNFHYYLTEEEHRQLKVADCFDGLMFCVEERRRGNRYVTSVAQTYTKYLDDMELSSIEAEIFMLIVQKWNKLQ